MYRLAKIEKKNGLTKIFYANHSQNIIKARQMFSGGLYINQLELVCVVKRCLAVYRALYGVIHSKRTFCVRRCDIYCHPEI